VRRAWIAILTVGLVAAAGAGTTSAAGAPATAAAGTCGSPAGTTLQPIRHVIVIMDENVSYSSLIGAPGSAAATQAPYLNDLATACGLATNYHAITHPSHSDYIAATAGDTYVPAGCSSWTCVSVPLNQPSIFGQLTAAGKSWRSYAEDMTSNCQTSASGQYSAGHNPPVWFTPIAADCKKWAVPIAQLGTDVAANALPSFSWIVPNKCNDMHNCATGNKITTGDSWIRDWMAKITATPDYQNGSTVVFITWDEGVEGGRPFNEDCLAAANLSDESCHVATIIASRWTQPGTRPGTFFTHYGLLKTISGLLGVSPVLRHGGDAGVNDMSAAFGLTGGGGPDTHPPGAPPSLTASATSPTGVHLAWGAATDDVGVDHYLVHRNGVTLAGAPKVLSFDDATATPQASYTYTVTAVDAAGNESQPSPDAAITMPPPDTQAPSAPSGLKATAVSSSQIDLTWTPSQDDWGVDHYVVRRDGGAVATPATAVFSDTGLAAGSQHTYTVVAVDAAGNPSSPSGQATATTLTGPTIVFSDDFESGGLAKWTTVAGLKAATAPAAFAGTYGARGTSSASGGRSATETLAQTRTDLTYDIRFKVISQGSNNIDLLKFKTSGGASIYTLTLTSGDKVVSRNSFAGVSHTSTTTISKGVWHEAVVHLVVKGASGSDEVWIDGTKLTSISITDNFGTAAIGRLQLGDANGTRTFDVAFDNVVAHL
jgi:phosphatidylinositol-3-phosphatase